MQVSHGAMLSIAEISLALYQTTNDETIKQRYAQDALHLTSILSNLPPRSLTTFGSEHVREGACHLITCLATTGLNTDPAAWKHLIHTSLERKEENVQQYAVLSFGAVAKTYGLTRDELDEALKKIDVNNIMIHGRRSYGLALGTIDYCKYPDWVHDVIVQLCKASQYQVSLITRMG